MEKTNDVESTRTENRPSIFQALVFSLKTRALQTLRSAAHLLSSDFRRIETSSAFDDAYTVIRGESRSPLWDPNAPGKERTLQAGKVENLRRACLTFDGLVLANGQGASFWAQVGRPSRLRGFVVGRELRQGCLVPSVGGGLCQLSNALYDAALQAGTEIVERHAHTQVVPGSRAELGRDATVFWNYVDLRLRPKEDVRIRCFLTESELVVRIYGKADSPRPDPVFPPAHRETLSTDVPNSCASCGVLDCFHNVENSTPSNAWGKTAFLVDEFWPEFDFFVCGRAGEADTIMLPIDGKKWKKKQYAWSTELFRSVRTFPMFALRRSIESRRLSAQGAARQRAILAHDAQLAKIMNKRLKPAISTLVVSQSLLPHLQRLGALGGRRVEVLLTRPPISTLQRRLDAAAQNKTNQTTLTDFRAPIEIVRTEDEAFANVSKIVTPHALWAQEFSDRSTLLAWTVPKTAERPIESNPKSNPRIGFLGPTVARKGAFEVRDAVRKTSDRDWDWYVFGSVIESGDFWDSCSVRFAQSTDFEKLDVVVAPSVLELAPRKLLAALALGIPVVATKACGILDHPRLTVIESPNAEEIVRALEAILEEKGEKT